MKRENFKGRQFGKLTVFREHKHGKDWWVVCLCECGLYVAYLKRFVQRRRPVQDCRFCHVQKGREGKRGRVYTMPYSMLPEYHSWLLMRQRCYDPKHTSYKEYGGRGITVDPAWNDVTRDGEAPPRGFNQFLHDVGYKPTPWHTLDRWPDNDGNYTKANVRWATPREQRLNQRPRKSHGQQNPKGAI
jgi:hypothetical protein